MSLRRDVHLAFDQIAPSSAGMPERVVHAVLANHKATRPGAAIGLRLRAPLSLVAVLSMIVVVAAVLSGGRVLDDWNTLRNGAPVAPSALAQLEARPLHIPVLHSQTECSPGPISAHGFGDGPIYTVPSGSKNFTVWGTYFRSLAYADTSVPGPVLMRGLNLLTRQRVVFVGPYVAGAVVGSDTIDGIRVQQRAEVLIDTSVTASTFGPGWDSTNRHSFDWPYMFGVPAHNAGSSGFQLDGPGFSDVFVVC